MSNPTVIVDLDTDVKPFLGVDAGDSSKSTLLQAYIDAATVWAEYVTDVVLPKTYTNEVHSGGKPHIFLLHKPIINIITVTEYIGPTAYTLTEAELGSGINSAYSYSVDNAERGVISRRWNTMVGNFIGGVNNISITYQAGRSTVPADIKLAVLMDIQGLYVGTQMGGRPAIGGGSPDFDYSSGPSIPLSMFPRLQSMIAPSARVPGIA